MAFSNVLAKAGTPPEHLHTAAEVSFDQVGDGWSVTRSALQVIGRVPGCTVADFERMAEEAKDGCPISRALKGNVELSVDATLEEPEET
jgi:osmotically inducible protein OsmC